MRPIPMVALNDHQVAVIYSLVLLALVQKTGSTVDRPGEPQYIDVLDRWLQASADELEERHRQDGLLCQTMSWRRPQYGWGHPGREWPPDACHLAGS
jgi:hypothetical protein